MTKNKLITLLLCSLFIACSSAEDDDPVMGNSQNEMENTGHTNSGNNENETTGYIGSFISQAHTTTGTAIVNAENTTLTLSDFMTDNGPKLEVYLTTDLTAGNYISLGELQGVSGTYNYTLPQSGVNFSTYKYVIIWCVDFSVNFGYAVLE